MGVFEKVIERHQPAANLAFSPPEAFAAIVAAAFNADGRVAPEEAIRVNEIFTAAKLFRSSPEPPKAIVNRVVELFAAHGTDAIVAMAARALPAPLRAPAFAVAVDLVLADGDATAEERTFVDRLQALLGIADDDAVKIVDVLVVKNSV